MFELVNPRQTVLVSCRGHAELIGRRVAKDDIITVDWHMPTSAQPFMYAISVGKLRFSHKLISDSKVFVVNFVSDKMSKKALFCGRHTGAHMDKFHESGLTPIESQTIDCPRIEEAVAYLECHVVSEIDSGDHTIFVARVTHHELLKRGRRLFHVAGDEFL